MVVMSIPLRFVKCKELIEYYLSLGLDVNAVDDQGMTPLHVIANYKFGNFGFLPQTINKITQNTKKNKGLDSLKSEGKHSWTWPSFCYLMVQIQH